MVCSPTQSGGSVCKEARLTFVGAAHPDPLTCAHRPWPAVSDVGTFSCSLACTDPVPRPGPESWQESPRLQGTRTGHTTTTTRGQVTCLCEVLSWLRGKAPGAREMLSVPENSIAPGLGFPAYLARMKFLGLWKRPHVAVSVSLAGEECRPS